MGSLWIIVVTSPDLEFFFNLFSVNFGGFISVIVRERSEKELVVFKVFELELIWGFVILGRLFFLGGSVSTEERPVFFDCFWG